MLLIIDRLMLLFQLVYLGKDMKTIIILSIFLSGCLANFGITTWECHDQLINKQKIQPTSVSCPHPNHIVYYETDIYYVCKCYQKE